MQRYWFYWFAVLYGLFIGLPFLAPVFMRLGWTIAGNDLYFFYSFFCHQLPERSYFFFGAKLSYSLSEIQAVWQNSTNPLVLRQFVGNPAMGWKVAWSDRMISMYTSIWIFSVAWWTLRKRIRPLPVWGLMLFILPMAVDGGTHFLSDLFGLGNGFRDANLWLASLTQNAFASAFYAGDAWGSFNSIMRLVTGILFGLGVVWFGFPYVAELFETQPLLTDTENLQPGRDERINA